MRMQPQQRLVGLAGRLRRAARAPGGSGLGWGLPTCGVQSPPPASLRVPFLHPVLLLPCCVAL